MTNLTIKAIKTLLLDVNSLDDERLLALRVDTRSGVQRLIEQCEKKIAKKEQLQQEHEMRLTFERELRQMGYQAIAGIDEVGRGPLAGPVVTAAVILPANCDVLIGVNDSKQLNHAKRQQFVEKIKQVALAYAITVTDVHEIDTYNIYEATRRSMLESVKQLAMQPDYLLIDAMKIDTTIPQQSIISGDQKSLSIAAASILAKEYRDALMVEYGKKYPEFGFEQHMGYGTKQHLTALAQYGYTPIHRQSFSPVTLTTQQYKKNI